MLQIASIALILLGIYGLLTDRNIIKILVSLNVFEIGLNIFIITTGYVDGGITPILTSTFTSSNANFVDPLPQALVLTAIVIGLGTTALGLAFARNVYKKYGTVCLDDIRGNK